MIDLVVVVADKNMQAAVEAVLRRHRSLGIRKIEFEIVRHPRRDPGCFHEGSDLLRGYVRHARHGLILLDLAWDGAPARTGRELERLMMNDLRGVGPGGWCSAVVIDPELEVWVFSESPHVARALGRTGGANALRAELERRRLWMPGEAKPSDPKTAVETLLREAGIPRSSSFYRDLASCVGLGRCSDPAFTSLKGLLRTWFGESTEEE